LVGAGRFIGASLRYITSAWLAQFARLGKGGEESGANSVLEYM